MKWLLITLWITLIFKEITWFVIGLEFWRQLGLGVIITFGLPIVIIILGLLNFLYGISGLRHSKKRKVSIASILSALICSSLAIIGLWGVVQV
jgi:hypothetical protein